MNIRLGGAGRNNPISRLVGAIVAVPIGIILVFGSCILLYWNEGRTDLSKVASKSTAVPASQVESSANNQFVSVTGSVTTGQSVSVDNYLDPSNYIAVHRTVEQYSWVQDSHTNNGNTTYSYSQAWDDVVPDSSLFNTQAGHQNPTKPLNDATVSATSATVGAYSFDPQTIKLPSLPAIVLTSSDVTVAPSSALQANPSTTPLSNLSLASSQYLYAGTGSLTSPQVGDIRISYSGIPSGTTGTIFGQDTNGVLGAYNYSGNKNIYDLLLGDRQTAIATLHNQYEKTTWIIRGVGVALIWLGLMMILSPLDALLDFIPFVGEIGGAITFFVTLPVALIIGGTAILIGYSFHHLIALIIGIPLIMLVWIGVFKAIKKARKISKKPSNGPPLPPPPQPPASPPPPPQPPVAQTPSTTV